MPLLRTRLFPLLFLLAVLPVAGMGGMFYVLSLRSVESVLEQQTLVAAQAAGTRLAAEFPRMKQESSMPARSQEVRSLYQARARNDSAAVQQVLQRELRPYLSWFLDAAEGRYARVIYLDASGEPLFKHDPRQESLLALGQPGGTAFVPGDQEGRPGPGEALRVSVQETSSYGTVLRLGRPVKDPKAPGSPSGYVLLDVPLERLLPARPGEEIALLLVDRTSGQVLHGPDRAWRGRLLAETLPGLAHALEAAGKDSSSSVKFTHQEEERLASYVELKEPSWTIAALVAPAPYTAAPRKTGLYTLTATGLFILFCGTLIFLLVRRVRERTVLLEEANRRLEEQNLQIQQASQHKSQFLSRMSHDLRTPMNAIIGYTRILLRKTREALDERQYQNLQNIQLSADHLLSLINDILDLSRVEAGRIELKPEAVDLKRLVQECTASMEPLLKPGVQLEQQLEDIPSLRTDPDRLRRVLMNLLSNAVKFTEQGSITISLHPAGNGVELAVADTGVGIPAEDLPHIFEEFHQVERTREQKPEGTGLGLAIVKKSVELLGGSIQVESQVGKGSTFTLRIADPRG